MPFANMTDARSAARLLRERVEPHFSPDTAGPSGAAKTPSAGHCAVVALIFRQQAGGLLVSAIVDGVSHWFNRIDVGGTQFDVDITGDQFGAVDVKASLAGHLYPGTRVRQRHEVRDETLERAALLAERSGLSEDARAFRTEFEERRSETGLLAR